MSVRVLVVDDDPDLCGLLREVLQEAGFSATATAAPRTLPRLLAAGRFDAVVCDQRLGDGLLGTTLLAAARREGLLEGTVCVLLSGAAPVHSDPWLRVLQKPVELDVLVKVLRDALGARSVRADRRGVRVHEVHQAMVETELEQPLRTRLQRELQRRRDRLGCAERALRLGKSVREVGEALREALSAAEGQPRPPAEEGGEARAALLSLEREALTLRRQLEGLTGIAQLLGYAH